MKARFDPTKSLQELEQIDWGEPTYHSSLVETCHHLRRKPPSQFTVEDLRIMISQQISLPILVPLAIERLEAEPLAEGRYYPGDLLAVTVKIDDAFWTIDAGSFQRVRKIVNRVKSLLPALDEIDRPAVLEALRKAPRSLME